jgi:hypothetical protein
VGLEPDTWRDSAHHLFLWQKLQHHKECSNEVLWYIINSVSDSLLRLGDWGKWSMYSVVALASLLFLSRVTYSSIIWENTI